MESKLKRLEIQRAEESKMLSESDKKLAEEYGFSVKTHKIYVQEGYYVASNSQLSALLAKVREDERERCAKQSARYYDQIAGIEIAGKIRNLK